MNIAIVGTGYVGLVSGTCFAEMGVHVTCVDVNEEKINALVSGQIPIYEPGLDEMVLRNYREGRLNFTTDLTSVLDDVDIVFSAVGTPPDEDGSADLQYVLAVARQFGRNKEYEFNWYTDEVELHYTGDGGMVYHATYPSLSSLFASPHIVLEPSAGE